MATLEDKEMLKPLLRLLIEGVSIEHFLNTLGSLVAIEVVDNHESPDAVQRSENATIRWSEREISRAHLYYAANAVASAISALRLAGYTDTPIPSLRIALGAIWFAQKHMNEHVSTLPCKDNEDEVIES